MIPRFSFSRTGLPVALAISACVVCCAGPLLTLIAGIGAISVGAALWMPALALVAVAAALGVVAVRRRRRRACRTGTRRVELGFPVLDAESPKRPPKPHWPVNPTMKDIG